MDVEPMSPAEFERWVMSGTEPGPFEPHPDYCPEGDLITVLWENVSCYAQSLPHGLALLRAQDDGRVVGCQVVAVRRLMEEGTLPATMYGD